MIIFLFTTFYKLVAMIFSLLVDLIHFVIQFVWSALSEIFVGIMEHQAEKRAEKELKKCNTLNLAEKPEDIQYKCDSSIYKQIPIQMYAIIRREPNGEWVQSSPIATYEEARRVLAEERKVTNYPRLLKKIYV